MLGKILGNSTHWQLLILDASAFIMGYEPSNIKTKQFSVPSVLRELIPESTPWIRFMIALEGCLLQIQAPTERYLEEVEEVSVKVGEGKKLSDTDREILALALEFKDRGKEPVIVSDDYSIQNIAESKGIRYISLSTLGIKYLLKRTLYCPACYRRYPSSYISETCRVCGTKLRRRTTRKTLATRGGKGE